MKRMIVATLLAVAWAVQPYCCIDEAIEAAKLPSLPEDVCLQSTRGGPSIFAENKQPHHRFTILQCGDHSMEREFNFSGLVEDYDAVPYSAQSTRINAAYAAAHGYVPGRKQGGVHPPYPSQWDVPTQQGGPGGRHAP